ncbi:MAG: DUF3536 domain-containing protein [Nitrospirota bacterium]
MERYICIHAHMYQPPRENPWLEAIEIQDSAYPYHDWNERITAECYAPNSASRLLDNEARISEIVSNYARISFNIGPTLLSWMETYAPVVYEAILEADRQSIDWRSGHGNAIAQVYNHIIMPLADARDKRTQIIWGIRDFQYRFNRMPEGMWLSETAVDIETLDIMTEHGIKFTILAPRQASKIRKTGAGKWKDVSGERIDPASAYLCRLPSGRKISIFFYDGPISQGVAFEKLLNRGEDFANRLLTGFSNLRDWPQILNIATDGETYGHHHRFGDMALAYALNYIESNGMARLTNYAEYLEEHPPTHEVQIFENSSWSCVHGVERWRSDCGCNTGGYSGWNQQWRAPLRDSLDWLREQLRFRYEHRAGEYFRDPWKARDEYIELILNRSDDNIDKFIERHAARNLNANDKINVLKLLEIQRHSMLMYTSCGWFFDELSGLETVQILQYAGRTIQLCEELFGNGLEEAFLSRLSAAKSNIPGYKDGANIYGKFVKPAMIDLKRVAAHYAVSSLFEDYAGHTDIFSYRVEEEDYQVKEILQTKIAMGKISATSRITGESEIISFCILHFGSLSLNGGVRTFRGDNEYRSMKKEMLSAFESGDFADIIRLMDNHFGMHNYSLKDLFKDEQRKILNILIGKSMEEFADEYKKMYESNRIIMGFLQDTGVPMPKAFLTAAEFSLNVDLKKAFADGEIDFKRIQDIISDIKKWGVAVDSIDIEFTTRQRLEWMMRKLLINRSDINLLLMIQKMLDVVRLLPLELNYWQLQNIYYRIAKTAFNEFLAKAKAGDGNASGWLDIFKKTGEMLLFNISALLPED